MLDFFTEKIFIFKNILNRQKKIKWIIFSEIPPKKFSFILNKHANPDPGANKN